MRIAFYSTEGQGDKLLVAAVKGGAARHGDEVLFIDIARWDRVMEDADAAAAYGIRASTRIILDAYRRAGKRTIYFDKGYWGRGIYTRVAVDAWQPTAYFRAVERGDDRLDKAGPDLRDVTHGDKIIYAATTQTWCDFYNLGCARVLDEMIVRMLALSHRNRVVVYRPRPGYARKHPELCTPIEGSELSDIARPLREELDGCSLLVTLGSNAAIEARAAGVETLVLGDNPAVVLNGVVEGRVEVHEFFCALSWCQWTLDEYLSGEAWAEIRRAMA